MECTKKIFLLIALALMSYEVSAQNPSRYNQYIFSQSFINPAYTGYKNSLNGEAYYRRQWMGLDGSPASFAVAVDGYLSGANLGVGLQAYSEQIGAENLNGGQLNLSYHLRLSDFQFLSFGIGAGAIQSTLQTEKLDPGLVSDPFLGSGDNQSIQPDLSFGVLYYGEFNYLGLSIAHGLASLDRDDNSTFRRELTPQANFTGGLLLDLTESISLVPSFFYRDDLKNYAAVDVNATLGYLDIFWLGAGYRTSLDVPWNKGQMPNQNFSSVLALMKLYLMDQLRIGYAFDYGLKGSNQRNFSSHELSVGFTLPNRNSRDRMIRLF